MKTNINISKESLREYRGEYIGMQREVERRRAQYQKMRRELHEAENEVIDTMYEVIEAFISRTGRFPNSAEITAAMDGRMTQHEVVGQLTVALGEHYNGFGKTSNARHEPTADRIGKVKADYRRVSRYFRECDEDGRPIEGGATKVIEDIIKVYGV